MPQVGLKRKKIILNFSIALRAQLPKPGKRTDVETRIARMIYRRNVSPIPLLRIITGEKTSSEHSKSPTIMADDIELVLTAQTSEAKETHQGAAGTDEAGLDGPQINIAEREDVPPDGGYGWVCTACVFMVNAHTWGVNSVCTVLSHTWS